MHFPNALPKAIVTPKAHIPLETGFASANSSRSQRGKLMLHKQHEIYMKYTCNIHGERQKIQRHLYSTDWRQGLASGAKPI